MTANDLADLSATLRDRLVLSVYVNGIAHDPAQRHIWRQDLGNAVGGLQETIANHPKAEREEFAAAAERLLAAIAPIGTDFGGPAWAAFLTADRMWFASALPGPALTGARWQRGVWAAPYMRTLKHQRPVIVAIVDNHSARLYRFAGGELKGIGVVDQYVHGGHADHLGKPPAVGRHAGTRGTTARDLSSAARVSARAKMIREVLERLGAEHLDEAGLLVGGLSTAAHALVRALPPHVAASAIIATDLHLRSSDAEILHIATRGASALRDAIDRGIVARLLEEVGAHGKAVAGATAAIDALADGAVQRVLLSERFLHRDADQAERIVELALEQRAAVEVVADPAAAQLEGSAGGVAAQLRFTRLPAPELR